MGNVIPQRLRPFVDLLQSTRAEYQRDQARYFAVAMVYYAFISLEPLLFLVVAARDRRRRPILQRLN